MALFGFTKNIIAGNYSDILVGSLSNNTIDGGGGNDSINSGAGDDTIFGSAGLDTIDGGAGADNIYGLNDADSIIGGDGDDRIQGGAGNDFINAGGGNDTIIYDEADYKILGGGGIDTLWFTGRNQALDLRNSYGLLAEDIHPQTGALWGNFPQTYSMVGLINSAMRLSRSWEEAF